MNTIKDRLKEMAQAHGYSIRGFEEKCGLGRGNISNMSADGSIGSDKLSKIIDTFPDANVHWLLTGNTTNVEKSIVNIGDGNVSAQNSGNNNTTTTTTNNYNNYKGCGGADKKAAQDISDISNRVSALEGVTPITDSTPAIPYYDVDFVAGFDEVINSQVTTPVYSIAIPGFEKATLWCNVTGHSMQPRINHNDKIALRECTVADIVFGKIYAVVLDTKRTVKILRKSKDPKKLRYVPINTDEYDDEDFPISRIIKIYEVLGSVQRFF